MADRQRSGAQPTPRQHDPVSTDMRDDEQEQKIVPLTRAEAERLFGPNVSRPSRVTPFRVITAQVIVSLLVTLVWWALSASPRNAAVSAWLGGMVGWVPGVFFALRLKVSRDRLTVSSLVIGEAIKVMTTIALFVAIATLYPAVHWVALLTTFVLVLKAHWLALAIK
ncbi:F0F1 ATP synthase subunit I [Pandoraea thiooxydans]|uniref:ATP synthase subunit I n=1 Tax=Pandoraea thiooxydans TaxID=445709 RepID=A0A0G3EUI2_9BURK|nr:ATP synthase subunit I [Pandoraea thiooxydans]AKJ69684.1 F0F1 ATP synthase subunit I [Pandoraea thiooxydans]